MATSRGASIFLKLLPSPEGRRAGGGPGEGTCEPANQSASRDARPLGSSEARRRATTDRTPLPGRRPDSAYTIVLHPRYNALTGVYDNAQVKLSNWTWTEIFEGAQTRRFQADSLGRPVAETHPENGTTTYGFSDNGVPLSKTDARGITTTMTYDALNRPLTITHTDGTPGALYEYDQGAFGIGRIHSASNANSSDVYTYDNMGRVVAQQKTIGGLLFTTSSTFNHVGLPETTTLPNGTTIDWSYDRMGRLAGVSSNWIDASHPATLASNLEYDATGAFVAADWGNGTVTRRTLNENKQLKTLRHGMVANPGQFLDLEYDYNEGVANPGRIRSIVDHNDAAKTVNYTYDGFKRLKTAETAGAHWGLSWTYDRYGNRLSQTATKGTPPVNIMSIDASSNRIVGWTYDAAGNTLDDGAHGYAYDANGMLTSVDGGLVQYKYDAGGNRVMKVTAAETVYYAFGAEYSSAPGWKRIFVSAGGIKVEYRDGQTFFHQADHLGTPRVQTDSVGGLVETWSHYPFGGSGSKPGRAATNTVSRGTGAIRRRATTTRGRDTSRPERAGGCRWTRTRAEARRRPPAATPTPATTRSTTPTPTGAGGGGSRRLSKSAISTAPTATTPSIAPRTSTPITVLSPPAPCRPARNGRRNARPADSSAACLAAKASSRGSTKP